MKDCQPVDSLSRVQRIRNIPIERIPSPKITSKNNSIPKLNAEDRFRIHSNQVERKIVPGASFLPQILPHQQQHPNPRHHGISLAEHHRRFDGAREKPQHNNNHHPHPSQNLRATPFGESLRRRNSPGLYEPSAGIQLVAQYGVVQDSGHSTASTPSASKPFPVTTRGGSLPTSHSINLPNQSYNYRLPMPARHHPPHPSSGHNHQNQSHQHPNHHHHHDCNHISENIVPEIESSGLPEDPEIEAERQEPDYHLVESGSDVILSAKVEDQQHDVPPPAPSSAIGATSGTRMHVPETDILDSSCSSDEDDDVVRNCDIEDNGNARGMNRMFCFYF